MKIINPYPHKLEVTHGRIGQVTEYIEYIIPQLAWGYIAQKNGQRWGVWEVYYRVYGGKLIEPKRVREQNMLSSYETIEEAIDRAFYLACEAARYIADRED